MTDVSPPDASPAAADPAATPAALDMGATPSPWRDAFVAVADRSDFGPLSELLDPHRSDVPGINAPLDLAGQRLAPLPIAVILGLEDLLPRFLALGADPTLRVEYEGLLCSPLHIAALRLEAVMVRHILEFLGPRASAAQLAETIDPETTGAAEAPATGGDGAGRGAVAAANAAHIMVLRDVWHEGIFRWLLGGGVPLSVPCKFKDGREMSGLLLARKFGAKEAVEECIDIVLGEEVKSMIRGSRLAAELNTFLEVCSELKLHHGVTSYRCLKDVDFSLVSVGAAPEAPPPGVNEAPSTALLYAADMGSAEALRLLLYAGADVNRTVQRVLPFGAQWAISLPLASVHLALLRKELAVVDSLLFFGVSAAVVCGGVTHTVPVAATTPDGGVSNVEVQEHWEGLTMLHLAVIDRNADIIPELLKRDCDVNACATRRPVGRPLGDSGDDVTPLHLAALLSEVRCTSQLLDCGAAVSEVIRAEACANVAVCEMFGGPPVVGIEDWVSALLTGETALQQLIDRRTDLARVLNWPDGAAVAALLERHRLASPALIMELTKTLTNAPTALRDVRPAHLACILQQPWAVILLADQGAPVVDAPPCKEAASFETGLDEASGLVSIPLDVVLLSARVGGRHVLELLCQDPRFAMDVNREIALVPDITPPFFPQRETHLAPSWAWRRLGPLELALLHSRVDMAVLLVQLGADLLHTVDHVAIRPPDHYSITELCYRGLTPLHLCALLDLTAAAAALLNKACKDGEPVVDGEFPRAQRQAMLSATCAQAWATVETGGDPDREPWLWRDLTPLHLALLRKNYATAELLVEVSTMDSLGRLCVSKDMDGDVERSFSALLLAFEQGQKELHRKIAKRFPVC